MKSIDALYKFLYGKLKQKPVRIADIGKREPKPAKIVSLYRKEPVARQHAKVISMLTHE